MVRWKLSKLKAGPIAVDFGGASLKLMQLTADEPPRLIAAAAKPLPGEMPDAPDAQVDLLAKLLRTACRDGGFRGRRALAAIPASMTFVRHVRIAPSAGENHADQVNSALAGQLPMDPGRMIVRHVDIGPISADGAAKREVICFAVARAAVMRLIHIIRKAGLSPVGLHCEPVALGRAFADLFRREDDRDRTVFFVDIGRHVTKAVISHGGDLAFAKLIQLGGDHLDRHFAEELGVELDEARRRRREQAALDLERDPAQPPDAPQADSHTDGDMLQPVPAGDDDGGNALLATFGPPRRAPLAPPDVAAHAPLRHETIPAGGEALDCLIDELQLCVGYHQSVFDDRPIEQIVFLGGEAHQSAMCRRIADALRLPGRPADPLGRLVRDPDARPPVGVDLRQPQPAWAMPLGLCRLPANL